MLEVLSVGVYTVQDFVGITLFGRSEHSHFVIFTQPLEALVHVRSNCYTELYLTPLIPQANGEVVLLLIVSIFMVGPGLPSRDVIRLDQGLVHVEYQYLVTSYFPKADRLTRYF